MKTIHVNNRTVQAKKILSLAEKQIGEYLKSNPEMTEIMNVISDALAQVYDTSVEDINGHLNFGLQVSIGFDYSFDFVKDKFKANPGSTHLPFDTAYFKNVATQAMKDIRNEEIVKRKEELAKERAEKEVRPTGFFKMLMMLGSLVPSSRRL